MIKVDKEGLYYCAPIVDVIQAKNGTEIQLIISTTCDQIHCGSSHTLGLFPELPQKDIKNKQKYPEVAENENIYLEVRDECVIP